MRPIPQKRNAVLRISLRPLIPVIMLFALYVQFHGDYGPGGGFQAGVMFSAALVLYILLFGIEKAREVLTPKRMEGLLAGGVFLYGAVGLLSIVNGGNFLDYNVLAHDPVHGQHYGIIAVELGVGITVTAVMATLFMTFVERGHRPSNEVHARGNSAIVEDRE